MGEVRDPSQHVIVCFGPGNCPTPSVRERPYISSQYDSVCFVSVRHGGPGTRSTLYRCATGTNDMGVQESHLILLSRE